MLEVGLLVAGGVIVSFAISTACYEMRRSRCTHISCCGVEIDRKLMSEESMKNDKKPELNIPTI
tara:strand:- start:1090 stop:1281 length:192 start_codon:yes stop_codon:yes gene_type:complete